MSAADARGALVHYLKSEIGELVENRIFRPKLPENRDFEMPTAAIVISGAGGASVHGNSFLPLGTPRIDFRCYGSTGLEADDIAQATVLALKRLRPSVWRGVKLHSANIVAELNPLVEADTLWVFSLVSAQVMYVEAG